MDTPLNSVFTEGVELFNQGKFFEAHEKWELVWRDAEGEDKLFFQSLIQIAAALLHVQRGNFTGAASLYAKARTKLELIPDGWNDIEIAQFRSELAQYLAGISNRRNGSLKRPPPQLSTACR